MKLAYDKHYPLLLLLTMLLGLGLRSVELDLRPFHTDEAVKAVKIFRPLWEGGGYRYDPEEHHGPTLAYSTLLWGKLTDARDFARWSEDRFRTLTIFFGLGLILLLPFLAADGLGRKATLGVALLTAVSPMMVYYSRDYIHEMLLVFFTFLALVAGWRYSRTRRIEWMLLAGAAIGLMQSTKETFVFNLAAAAGAGLLNQFFASSPVKGRTTKPIPAAHLIAGFSAWIVVAALLLSSFLTHLSGPLDALKTYVYWGSRAQGASVHVHGVGFYWQRLLFFHVAGGPVWSEGLILALAGVAGWAVLARREMSGANVVLVRFLLFYTIILAGIYTALPYKTPWCALGFWHGMILLAGAGAVSLLSWLSSPRLKMGASIILLTGVAHLAFQSWQSDVEYAADQSNPWNYAQTSPDLLNLVRKVDDLARVSPDGTGTRINIMAPDDDYYPLPWYLRRFANTGWWDAVPGFSKFSTDGDMDAVALAANLRAKTNAVSRFLMESALGKYLDTPQSVSENAKTLETILVTNLNQILTGPSIFDSNRFQNIHLRPETEQLRSNNPDGQDLIRLNRMLLEDVYTNGELRILLPPDEIYPPITIVSAQLEDEIDPKKAGIMAGLFKLRPGTFLELYAQTNLWSAYLAHSTSP